MLKKSRVVLQFQKKSSDYWLAILALSLTLFGLLMVYDASVVEAYRKFGDKYFYLKNQLQWAAIGFLMLFGFARINYHRLQKLAGIGMIISLVLLFLILIPGLGIKVMGAKRWLKIGPLSLQPAELIKLTFVIYTAAWLSKKRPLFPLILVTVLVLALILLEPDLGTAVVVIGTVFLVYFASGGPLLYLTIIGLFGGLIGSGLIWFFPYRRERLLTFLDPARDPLGASYHLRQILIALGSGGFFGLGLGKSRQKYEYLPAVTTDSIFAVIAEEIGFIGSTILIFFFLLLLWRGIKIAKQAPDRFGQLLAIGIISWLGIQTIVNLGAMVSLLPLTGVPLPFISYGGSSLVTSLTAMGILLNISQYRVQIK